MGGSQRQEEQAGRSLPVARADSSMTSPSPGGPRGRSRSRGLGSWNREPWSPGPRASRPCAVSVVGILKVAAGPESGDSLTSCVGAGERADSASSACAPTATRTRGLPLRRSFYSAWRTAASLARVDFLVFRAIAQCLLGSLRSGTQRARYLTLNCQVSLGLSDA
jgi:hypothetical protein